MLIPDYYPGSFLSACQNQTAKQPEPVPVLKTDSIPKTGSIRKRFIQRSAELHLDSGNIESIFAVFPCLAKYSADVRKFYCYRNYSYAWYESSGLIEQASHLYTHLNNMEDEGIPGKASLSQQTG